MEIVTIEKKPLNFGNRGLKTLWGVWMRSACLYAGSVTSGWITARPAACLMFQPGRFRPTVIRGNCLIRRLTIRFTTRLRTWKHFCLAK